MATELIADTVTNTTQVIPNGMSINPWLDWAPVLGIPAWVYVTCAFVLLVLAVVIYWLLRIGRLASVSGYVEAIKTMTQEDVMIWVISRTQKLTIECMTIKDHVVSRHNLVDISMWCLNSPMGIVRVGGITGAVVSEDYDKNRDFVTEIALCHALDEFNEDQPKLTTGLTAQPVSGFEDYENYGREDLESLHPNGLETPAYNIFNPNRFRKYFPQGCSAMFFGGELIYAARNMNIDRKEKGFWEVHAFLALAGGIGLLAIVVAWLVPLWV
jgi:hypothetical protein